MSRTVRGIGTYTCATCHTTKTARHIIQRAPDGGVRTVCDGACKDD